MRRFLTALLSLLLSAGVLQATATAETIAIIGTGEVGSALGRRFGELDHVVVYGSRDPERDDVRRLVAATRGPARATSQADAVVNADIVVLAIPWDAAREVTETLGDLSGRLVIDPTNPRRIDADGFRDYAFDGSNAERIAEWLPGADVVKAFSTLGAATMLEPSLAGGPVSIPLAGDDADAKRTVAALARELGFEPVDVGPLRFARVIEGLHFLRYNAGLIDGRFNYYLRPSDE